MLCDALLHELLDPAQVEVLAADARRALAHQALGLGARLALDLGLLLEVAGEDGGEARTDRLLGRGGLEQLGLHQPPDEALGHPLDLCGRRPHGENLSGWRSICKGTI